MPNSTYETEKKCFDKAHELVRELSKDFTKTEIERIGSFILSHKDDYSFNI